MPDWYVAGKVSEEQTGIPTGEGALHDGVCSCVLCRHMSYSVGGSSPDKSVCVCVVACV